MDMVSIESERGANQNKNFLESKGNEDDKDIGSRVGTPPKILKKNSFSREESSSSTSRELRNSRNMAQAKSSSNIVILN